jgi:hypothetical protein
MQTKRIYPGRHKLTTAQFVERSNIIHNKKYNYDKVDYQKSSIKVTISCPLHGDWYQTPNHHLAGKGCTVCGNINAPHALSSNSKNKNQMCYLYKIQLHSANETFIKIGITVDLKRRFSEFKYHSVYTVTPLFVTIGSLADCFKMEQYLHTNLKHKSYIPAVKFEGYTECFLSR